MGWAPLTETRLGDLIRFLGPREAYCAAFTEKLLREGTATVPDIAEQRVLIRGSTDGGIDGAILQGSQGFYYPVLSDSSCQVEGSGIDLLRRNTRRIYSLMGRSLDVNALEAAFGKSPSQAVEYYLMVQDSPPPEIPLPRLPDDFTIHQSGISDAAKLSAIQKQYEIEEVMLPGNSFDASASLNHLKASLRSQMIIYATAGNVPVAKAGTNARGLFYDQIGGVFTQASLRSRGIGTALMLRLLSMVAADNKSATLFVKMENGPALRMYQNLGFKVLDDFRISYYR